MIVNTITRTKHVHDHLARSSRTIESVSQSSWLRTCARACFLLNKKDDHHCFHSQFLLEEVWRTCPDLPPTSSTSAQFSTHRQVETVSDVAKSRTPSFGQGTSKAFEVSRMILIEIRLRRSAEENDLRTNTTLPNDRLEMREEKTSTCV